MKTIQVAGITIDENKIEMTEDYEMFKRIKGNRKIYEQHVLEIMERMKKNDLFTPIIVNEKMEVIDGQHTLEARKRLKFIVPYFIREGYGLDEVQLFNSMQKKWTNADFAQSYAARGNRNYTDYIWFRQRYKLPHVITVQLLHETEKGHGKNSEIFIAGELKVKSIERAKAKAELLEKIAPYFAGYRDRNFAQVVLQLLEKKVFNFDRFLQKVAAQPNALKKCATADQYLDLIEYVYNWKAQEKVSLKYAD